MDVRSSKKRSSPFAGVQWRTWLFSWEMYLIVLVAAFLRLYRINTTEFDGDQANIFRMAYGALHHGLFVATANGASIHIMNPPAVIYLLMLTAAWSADPLWAAVLQAVSAILAVLLTYVFVRRYYGRLAGTIAGLLFATAEHAVFYSRFIWQQNFIPFFLLLFLFALFWGVVERRKGWLFPAIFLVGLLLQLHATAALLVAPLLVALLLAPGTVRWRDLVFGLLSLLVIYFPYLLWEVASQFSDVHILLNQDHLPSQIDNLAWIYYQYFLTPYSTVVPQSQLFSDTHSILFPFFHKLSYVQPILTALLIAGGILALALVFWPRFQPSVVLEDQPTQGTRLRPIVRWWTALRADPWRCGLLVLLIWQIVPLLALSRHTLPVYPHYLIVLLPGPYIFIALFLAKCVDWSRHLIRWSTVLRIAVVGVTALLIGAQCLGSVGTVLDFARGNYPDTALSRPYYNDLNSLQHALSEADQLAQQRHLNRVYIATDQATQMSLTYLAGQMRTPTTLFDDKSCAVLPGTSSGPAVMLLSPRSELAAALVNRYSQATLVDQLKRLGGPPFQLYIVNPTAQPSISPSAMTFQGHLQALDTTMQSFSFKNASWQVARWSMQHAAQADFRVTYGYTLSIPGQAQTSECSFSAIHAGDQLLTAFPQSVGSVTSPSIKAQFFTIKPRNFSYGPFTFETDAFLPVQSVTLIPQVSS